MAITIPVAIDKNVMGHEDDNDVWQGRAIGGLGYAVPIIDSGYD